MTWRWSVRSFDEMLLLFRFVHAVDGRHLDVCTRALSDQRFSIAHAHSVPCGMRYCSSIEHDKTFDSIMIG